MRSVEGVAASWHCILLRRSGVPVHEAERLVLPLLENPPTLWTRGAALGTLGTLRAMEGAFDEGRALVAENHAILEDLGHRQSAAADSIAIADIEIIAGELEAAERILRTGLAEVHAVGDRFSAVNAAWRLAFVLVQLGRDEEAESFLQQATAEDAGDYVEIWRLVLGATLAARRGETELGERLLAEAVSLIDDVYEIGLVAEALIQAAEASGLLGHTGDAVAHLERAAELAARLGYVVAERTARERLAATASRRGS
jgi:tetratricopeptide (TPR) repeat protein